MVTADETVVATPTTTTTTAPEEPKSGDVSGNSSDSDADKIEFIQKLKASAAAAAVIEPAEGDENVEEVMEVDEAPKLDAEEVNGTKETSEDPSTSSPEEDVKEVEDVVMIEEETNEQESNGKQAENGNEESPEVLEASEPSEPSEKSPEVEEEEPLPALAEETAKDDEIVELEPTPEKETTEEQQNGKGTKRPVECIQLEDDDDDEIQEVPAPAPKKAKVEEPAEVEAPKEEAKTEEAAADDNEKAQKRLLDKLEEYVREQHGVAASKNRKILDTLLGAINAQVQKEPLSVRKLILDKILVLPNTISFPPSQVCDLLIEHDPEMPLTKVITRMFGDERPKLSDSERRERSQLKLNNPVPNMTKLLVDIGQDLVQEATYCDIVHAKNLPEVPKNLETYKQVAAQLKPVWETLKRKNEPYKLKMNKCGVCGFQTESKLVMSDHKATLHNNGTKFQCTFCKETDTNEQRMKEHYYEAHLVIAKPEEKESKYPCAICEEDFNFKGVREQHYKQCKKDYIRIRNIMMPKPDDYLHLNRWLWEKPPVDPSILQQQQQAALQQAQQKRQQLLSQQQQAAAAAALLRKQQLQQAKVREQVQQQQLRQMTQLLTQTPQGRGNIGNSLIAAMQASLKRSGQAGSPSNAMAVTQLIQKQMAAAMKSQAGAQIQAAFSAAALKQQRTPTSTKMQKVLGTSGPSAASSPSSSQSFSCEICDQTIQDKERYLLHLQGLHKQMVGKTLQDMAQGAPLACSRCRDRFWTYEGLERHLVMSHGLVTADLLQKAQKKEDGGRCKTCGKQYAFNMLQHLVADHQVKLCSAEIMYSCDVCAFKCSSYQILEAHLTSTHPKGEKKTPTAPATPAASKKDECITLDD